MSAAPRAVRLSTGWPRSGSGMLQANVLDVPLAIDGPSLVQSLLRSEASGCLLDGRDPLLRPDLIDLVESLRSVTPHVSIASDFTAGAMPDLGAAGIERAWWRLFSSQPQANDWCLGVSGSLSLGVAAVRRMRSEGIAVGAEIVLTRPTLSDLPQTVRLAASLGIAAVVIRFPFVFEMNSDRMVQLMPRFAPSIAYLAAAQREATSQGITIGVLGMPSCLRSQSPDNDLWGLTLQWADSPHHPAEVRVACSEACPGPLLCCGVPEAYVSLFGWNEFAERLTPSSMHRVPSLTPPPRRGREPATRLNFVKTQVDRGTLHGDPLIGYEERPGPASMLIRFEGPAPVACPSCGDLIAPRQDTARDIRIRMSRASQEGAPTLRIAGAATFHAADAASLLRDALRLSFSRLEIAGEGSGIARFSDGELGRLKGLALAEVPIYGASARLHDEHAGWSGAYTQALEQLKRLRDLSGSDIGAYAILHGARQVFPFAELWDREGLPGPPKFRLSPEGGDLDALATEADRLPRGPARAALESLLPHYAVERSVPPAREWLWDHRLLRDFLHSGSDWRGDFQACPCEDPLCVGFANGWHASATLRTLSEIT